jgi:hypothetical protein
MMHHSKHIQTKANGYIARIGTAHLAERVAIRPQHFNLGLERSHRLGNHWPLLEYIFKIWKQYLSRAT